MSTEAYDLDRLALDLGDRQSLLDESLAYGVLVLGVELAGAVLPAAGRGFPEVGRRG